MCGQPSLLHLSKEIEFSKQKQKFTSYLFATLTFLQSAVIRRKQIIHIFNSVRITFPPLRCRPLWSWGTLWGTGWTPCSSASRHCPCPLISSSAQPGKQFQTLKKENCLNSQHGTQFQILKSKKSQLTYSGQPGPQFKILREKKKIVSTHNLSKFKTLKRRIVSTHIFDSKLLFQKLCCHASFLTRKRIFLKSKFL